MRVYKIFFIVIFVLCNIAYSHPGRLDKNGGHYDKKTGSYHYHRSPSTPKPTAVKLSDRDGTYISDKDNISINIDDNGNALLMYEDGSQSDFYIGKPTSTSKEFSIDIVIKGKEYKKRKLLFTSVNTFTIELDKSYTFTKK